MAGAGGDSGKTLVSLGLASAWRRDGRKVAAFKKGPDYIDAAWLARAARRPARNLDSWLCGPAGVLRTFFRGAGGADVCVVEGNRGVLDGYEGHSTAALARLLGAPLVLVLDVTKVTRTAAALVAGLRVLEPGLRLAGVVLNRVAGPRHVAGVRAAVEGEAGVPVLGAIPKLDGPCLPDRHLGLVPPEEHGRMEEAIERLAETARERLDLSRLLAVAGEAGPLAGPPGEPAPEAPATPVRVGVFRDSAFTFTYPDNLEALEERGAEIVPISAFTDTEIPDVDLLVLGGGFPETQAEALSANRSLLFSVREACRRGLPVYAECGGLIYLARSVTFRGRRFELAGVLPVDVEVGERPQGHGYVEAEVAGENPFFAPGTRLRGHEFHYSRLRTAPAAADTALRLVKGAGFGAGRDGLVQGNVMASWVHLHAGGTPEWAPALLARARAGSGPAARAELTHNLTGSSR